MCLQNPVQHTELKPEVDLCSTGLSLSNEYVTLADRSVEAAEPPARRARSAIRVGNVTSP